MRLAPASPLPRDVPKGWFVVVSLRSTGPADWSLIFGPAVTGIAPWEGDHPAYPRALVTVGVMQLVVDMSAAEVMERVDAARRSRGIGVASAIRAAAARGATELGKVWAGR